MVPVRRLSLRDRLLRDTSSPIWDGMCPATLSRLESMRLVFAKLLKGMVLLQDWPTKSGDQAGQASCGRDQGRSGDEGLCKLTEQSLLCHRVPRIKMAGF